METQEIASEELAPDTGKPVSKLNLGRFGAGFIFFCVVFMMSGTIGSTVLLPARFDTLGIGQGETILGTMNSIGIIFALNFQRDFRRPVRFFPQPLRQAHSVDHCRWPHRRHWFLFDLHLPNAGHYRRFMVVAASRPQLHARTMRGNSV